jgi:hypothetical protein
MDANRDDARKPPLLSVEHADPLILSCAICGWTPQHPDDRHAGPLLGLMIQHWLTAHWASASDDALADETASAEPDEQDGQG